MNKFAVFGVIVSCFVAVCFAANFEDCGSTVGKWTNITVNNCKPEETYCPLKKGKNSRIGVIFQTTKPFQSVTAKVWGIIAGAAIPFPLPNADGCTSGVQCPGVENTPYNYSATLFVEKFYPTLQLIVKWELVNEQEEIIACALIPAKLR